jgi:hypothetical protein
MLKRTLVGLLCLALSLSVANAASSTLSNLSAGNPVSSGDLFYDVQSAGSGGVKVTAAQLAAYLGTATITRTTVRLTNSQIANLTTTPITIVPAQGANTIVEVVQAMYVYVNSGQSFTEGGPGGLYYNNNASFAADGGDQQVAIGGSGGGGSASAIGLSYANNNLLDIANMVNQPVTYSNFNAPYTGSGGGNEVVVTVLWISVPTQ